ncbi:MAG: YfcC family protein, partial [Anaerovoracaceae bacterium]
LNFLIPSGSGQAAVSMPIMTPIADLIGMNRQIAVLIFQFGDGFSNLIWPTSFMVIACAMAKIPLNKYYKWLLPFFGICFAVQCLFIFGAIAMNYA